MHFDYKAQQTHPAKIKVTGYHHFHRLLLVLCILALSSCHTKPKAENGYVVHGSVEGLNDGKAILAKLDLISNETVQVDSTDIRDGEFIFQGKIDQPFLHSIFVEGQSKPIHFFLENSDIDIHARVSALDQAQVMGSREDSLFRAYTTDEIFDRKKGMEIMLEYPDYVFSAFTAYYQFQIFNISVDTMDLIMNQFSMPVKESIYYRHLDQLYQTLNQVAVSKPAPQFSIPDQKGNPVRLDDFKGKYVLIDFWASWCAPCRAANPILVEAYGAYRERGFTIVGISIDKNRKRWIEAIETDQLPWTNLSNLRGWDEVSNAYGVKAVPQNFLLDPDAIIIAKNIEPEHLSEQLDEILPF